MDHSDALRLSRLDQDGSFVSTVPPRGPASNSAHAASAPPINRGSMVPVPWRGVIRGAGIRLN